MKQQQQQPKQKNKNKKNKKQRQKKIYKVTTGSAVVDFFGCIRDSADIKYESFHHSDY